MNLEKQNWLQLASVQIGGAICLPMILIGYELARHSLQEAILAIIVGNFLLFLMAIFAGRLAFESSATTAENAALYFGKEGKKLFGLILLLSMSAWFAIQSSVMAEDLGVSAGVISAFIVLMSYKGIRSLVVLSEIAVPLMLITLACSLVMNYFQKDITQGMPPAGSFASSMSLVIAAAIFAIVDLPTFFRHAATKRDAQRACLVIFLLGLPLVEIAGALLGAWTPNQSLLESLSGSTSVLWRGWIWLFILLAGWTTNNANLYSAQASLQAIFPKTTSWQALVWVGSFCVLMSCVDIMAHFQMVLEVMTVLACSMGAVIICAYWLLRSFKLPLNTPMQTIAWVLGICMGCANLFCDVRISQIALLDAGLVSASSLLAMKLLEKRREESTTT